MAQVVQSTDAAAQIDYWLDYLLTQWEGVAEVAAEWDEWNAESRQTYAANWGIPRERFHQLQRWIAQYGLPPAQELLYRRLLAVMSRQQPTLERLLAG